MTADMHIGYSVVAQVLAWIVKERTVNHSVKRKEVESEGWYSG